MADANADINGGIRNAVIATNGTVATRTAAVGTATAQTDNANAGAATATNVDIATTAFADITAAPTNGTTGAVEKTPCRHDRDARAMRNLQRAQGSQAGPARWGNLNIAARSDATMENNGREISLVLLLRTLFATAWLASSSAAAQPPVPYSFVIVLSVQGHAFCNVYNADVSRFEAYVQSRDISELHAMTYTPLYQVMCW